MNGKSTGFLADMHTYRTHIGWANTHLDCRESRLRVVSGFDDPEDALDAMLAWRLESDENWVNRVVMDLAAVEMRHDILEDTLHIALHNRLEWLQLVGDPSLLLPFVRRELALSDEQTLEDVILSSLTTFRKVFRSRC